MYATFVFKNILLGADVGTVLKMFTVENIIMSISREFGLKPYFFDSKYFSKGDLTVL